MKTALLSIAFSTFASSLLAQTTGGSTKNPFDGLQQQIDALEWTYKSDTPRMSPDEARALAQRLSQMSGVLLELNPDRSDAEQLYFGNQYDPSAKLEVDLRSRGFLFNGGYAELRREEHTPRLPKNKARIRRLATQYLEGLGLLPKAENLAVEHIGGLNMAVVREDGSTDDYCKLASIRFGRTTDAQNTQGPGSRIQVHLGEAGRLQGLIWQWESFSARPLPATQKIPADEIQRLALHRMNDVTPHAVGRRIKEVDVVFFDDGFGILEPCVHVVADLRLKDHEGKTFVNPFDFYLPIPLSPEAFYPFLEDRGVPAPSGD